MAPSRASERGQWSWEDQTLSNYDKKAMLAFYDHAEREFAGLGALYERLSPDWDVAFRSEHYQVLSAGAWAFRRKPRIMLVPQCYRPSDLERLLPVLAAAPEIRILVTHEEQLTMPIFRSLLWPSTPASLAVIRQCWHIVWNDRSADILAAQGIARDRIFVCGHLRSAVRAHERSAASRTQIASRWGLDPSKTWVLFAENRTNLLEVNEYERNGFLEAGVIEADLAGLIAEAKTGVDDLMSDLAEVGSSSPELLEAVEFVYRPHPGKSVGLPIPEWVRTISDGDIHEWLSAIDVYATHQSTSIFEASLYGLPCFRIGASTYAYTIEGVRDIPVVDGGVRSVIEFAAGVASTIEVVAADVAAVAAVAKTVFGDPTTVIEEYLRAVATVDGAKGSSGMRSWAISLRKGIKMIPRRAVYEFASYFMVRTGLIRWIKYPRSTASHLSQVPHTGKWEWPGA